MSDKIIIYVCELIRAVSKIFHDGMVTVAVVAADGDGSGHARFLLPWLYSKSF